MKNLLAATVLTFGLLAAATEAAEPQELPKIKVAVVRFNRLMNNELIGYETVRLLAADKESLEVLKKTLVEIKAVQKDIVAAAADSTLNELNRKYEFLQRKYNMLRQNIGNRAGGDMQRVLREFVVARFKSQYHLIAQEPEALDRFLSKENVEIADITDDVAAKAREAAAEISGQ